MFRYSIVAVIVGFVASAAFGQGIIVDRRPSIPLTGSYQVSNVSVDATVRDQVATVQVSQTFHNPTGRQIEAEYLFPLPEDGAVSDLVLTVDGKEMPGKLLPADEARAIYESIVRSKKDPALLEFVGRGLFRTSVFPIAAGKSSTVTMKYTQVCRREFNAVSFAYPLGTHRVSGKPVGELSMRVRITGKDPIKSVYSPSHGIDVKRAGDRDAIVTMNERDLAPSGDFRLIHNLSDEAVGTTVLSYRPVAGEDGYFLALVSPGFTKPDAKPARKSVVFVIDKSGSMSGKKIEQARKAAAFVVNNLNEGDTFNIIAYSGGVEMFQPELQTYNRETRRQAIAYIESIRDGGSTDINSALTTALGMLNDKDRPNYVLFLTDGLPTAGEQDEMRIARNASAANQVGARVISFGVGFDVNARLLDRLSNENGGVSEYVKPDDNLEAAVSRFAGRLTAPVLTDIEIQLTGTPTTRAYPREVGDLFEGGQLVYVGRYAEGGKTTVNVTGKLAGETKTFATAATLADAHAGSAYAFVEKLWATRRIGEIIDQLDLHGKNQELIDELVRLSTKHGILTPYTSFLADENTVITDVRANAARADDQVDALQEVSGESAVAQRESKAVYKKALQVPADSPTEVMDTDGVRRQVTTVRNVGTKTFYQRDGVWRDAAVSEADEKNVIVIEQFSEPFYELVRNNRAEMNQYLTFDEDTLVELDGQTYRIEAAADE